MQGVAKIFSTYFSVVDRLWRGGPGGLLECDVVSVSSQQSVSYSHIGDKPREPFKSFYQAWCIARTCIKKNIGRIYGDFVSVWLADPKEHEYPNSINYLQSWASSG